MKRANSKPKGLLKYKWPNEILVFWGHIYSPIITYEFAQ
jgi:hypothetical protein